MNEYRTPEEDKAVEEQYIRVARIIDRAVENGASLVAAMILGESQDVVERWTNALWDGLRTGLSGRAEHPRIRSRSEDVYAAVVLLIEDRIRARADAILTSPVDDQ